MKPYFDGFLNEAGKDHYVVLRTTLKGLWNHFFKKDRNFRVAVLTAKGEMKQEYSLLFSIYAEIDNKKKVKFLIREGCSEENYAKGIDAFLDLIESYHMDDSSKEVDIDLDGEKDNWGQILIEFDTEMKCLRVLDPISHAKNRNKM